MPETITAFDIAEHLETDAEIQAFLRETDITGDASKGTAANMENMLPMTNPAD